MNDQFVGLGLVAVFFILLYWLINHLDEIMSAFRLANGWLF